MSRYDKYEPQAVEILRHAQEVVRLESRPECTAEDLLLAFLRSGSAALRELLETNGLRLKPERESAGPDPHETRETAPGQKIKLSPEFREILDRAESLAGASCSVSPLHLLHAAWPTIADKFASMVVTRSGEAVSPNQIQLPELSVTQSRLEKPRSSQSAYVSTPLRVLPELGRELTASERKFPVIGRDDELTSVTGILLKFFKPNVLLVGEAGVGKTALVEALADRIRQGSVPTGLAGARIFEVPVSNLLAGTGLFGSLEDRMKALIAELESVPNLILFLDEIHQLTGKGSGLGDILKPALARGKFRCIGATTPAEYHRAIAPDAALNRRFEVVHVQEPDRAAVGKILDGLRAPLETHYRITVPADIMSLVVDLTEYYLPHLRFPDKAIDVLDRALSHASQSGRSNLDPRFVREAVARLSGVAFVEDSADFRNRLDNLESLLSSDILGQEEAVRAVAAIVRMAKRRLDLRPERPDGVFLFLGPTGVGKTALAGSLARHLTGRDDSLIRLDMSEFSESHTVARIIGSPAGYVGYEDQPQVLAELSRNRSGVLLLDEIEKAHPAVHRLWLQALDAGRLTDARGNQYSLSTITIVATANTGPARQASGIGFAVASREGAEVPWDLLKSWFSTDLLSRFDEIVMFRPIDRRTAREILRRIIVKRANQRLAQHGVRLELSEEAEEALLNQGHSEQFGVRLLERVFEERVMAVILGRLDRKLDGDVIRIEASEIAAAELR
ncbi:MAG: AAA family ATPase [Acidobacteriota bacterium]